MSRLFGSEFQDNYDCLFQRALFTLGNYLVPISGHYTFCNFEKNLRAKMDNWRKVFNDDIRNTYLKQLLDAITDSIKNDLQTIIIKKHRKIRRFSYKYYKRDCQILYLFN